MGKHQRIDEIFHRSKDRIRDLGEVFTPDDYVESMLRLISKNRRNFWDNEDISFFEPSCGHGNIVLAIVSKRLESLYSKAKSKRIKKPEFFAVANTVNTIWAIDICQQNVEHCRERVLSTLLHFLEEKTKQGLHSLIHNETEFFAHLISALKWHISENEALSSLSTPAQSHKNAAKTRMGSDWLRKNEHTPMEFSTTWVEYFKDCDSKDLVPLDFERSLAFLKNILSGSTKGQRDFPFTKSVIPPIDQTQSHNRKTVRGLEL